MSWDSRVDTDMPEMDAETEDLFYQLYKNWCAQRGEEPKVEAFINWKLKTYPELANLDETPETIEIGGQKYEVSDDLKDALKKLKKV